MFLLFSTGIWHHKKGARNIEDQHSIDKCLFPELFPLFYLYACVYTCMIVQ